MTERIPPGGSEPPSEDAALARHIEAVNWFMQGNRRLYDRELLPPWVLIREVARLQARTAAIERSTIWRMTEPLRRVKQWISRRRVRPTDPGGADWQAVADHGASSPIMRDPYADYAAWIARDEAASHAALRRAAARGTATVTPRLALILTVVVPTREALGATLEALRGTAGPVCSVIVACCTAGAEREMLGCYAQSEPNVTVLTLPEGTTAGAARAAASHHADADFIGFLDLPDRIAPAAVGLIDAVIALDPQSELIFGDEDVLDRAGQRSDPFFKPGWDPELHSAGDLLGPLLIVRRDVLNRIQPWPEVESLRLLGQRAVTACRTDRIRHIPAVLCHRAAPEPIAARWTSQRHAVPRPAPLVSLIVPTKNRADLLRTCVDGVLNGTDYSDIELLILDNGTEEPEAVGLLHELASHDRVRVLALPGPFNWSALNNAGARAARGDILVLMNNDIAILQPDWLDEMVAQAARPEIGAVGAKLLYPDGALEHAGIVIVADGVPQHLFRRAPADTTFLNGTLKAVRSVSVVTGACLAVRRRSFFEVGGLDEGLAVSCNDVDLCLRLLAHGYRNVWTPFAVLEHREMASRGPDRTPAMRARTAAELDRLSGTWGSAAVSDGYFNPNLELVGEQPQLRCRGG